MKIFTCDQIKQIDEYTIKNEPVPSTGLMERAAGKIFSWLTARFSHSDHFIVFTGPGNNGGDGIALSRMVLENGYEAEIYYLSFTDKVSADWDFNRKRLETEYPGKLSIVSSADHLPVIQSGSIIIDSIFGSGLKRPSEGLAKEAVKIINSSDALRIAVDMPSGLFCENNDTNDYDGVVRADHTLSFQFPKLAFMFAENAAYTGDWQILDIGLHKAAVQSIQSPYRYVEITDIIPLLRERKKFDHKGNFGHGLLVSGSFGKMGAAVMGAGAALRTGIGLVTCHIPACGYNIMQSAMPEAMAMVDSSDMMISGVGPSDRFDAVGVGPGIGTDKLTQDALFGLLKECRKPMVIDADGLNILSMNKEWLRLLQPRTILTPHPKEFERLAGKSSSGFDRLRRQIDFSKEYNCIMVLKGACTSVALPDGNVFFNSTGNPGMATGGSGDVLTGMVLSLLAQGYRPADAAVTAVFLHGLAGDIAASMSSMESIIASDIINCIGEAFKNVRNRKVINEV
jgi:NAD(P)H-hydrate epimerase